MNRQHEPSPPLPINLETLYEEDEVAEAAVPYTARRANDLNGTTWTRYSISIWSDLCKTSKRLP